MCQSDNPQAFCAPCDSGWTEKNNTCYIVMRGKVNWTAADSHCKQFQANLASIKDADENSLVTSLIGSAPEGRTPLVWIGLKDVKKRRGQKWAWTDGSSFSFANWARGLPSNLNLPKQRKNCVGMYSKNTKGKGLLKKKKKKKKGEWTNAHCSNTFPYICMKPKLMKT
ncbi:PREDICTED: snaclec agkisacutacin subunit A-like [Branchiostoma belcheri]|uniref:Snaclec agkisacutacin subunit A-like n=1 Tax=Branchiostoma belcheri TaxID=7741 RepID=A0A6P4XVF0_BRABE|nr:PREDICTED: snaclec agkisacutacin subunit A-like [Branchiostoma belcheri]